MTPWPPKPTGQFGGHEFLSFYRHILMLDLTKEYTCNGKRVVGLRYTPLVTCPNGTVIKVTYPIKGSIVAREKPMKLVNQTWSEDGVADIVWGKGPNLVEKEA